MRAKSTPSNPGPPTNADRPPRTDDIHRLAAELSRQCAGVPHPATDSRRRIRREYSRLVRNWPVTSLCRFAKVLCRNDDDRWLAYEIVATHRRFLALGDRQIEQLGQGLNGWQSADAFARTVTGPAWLNGQVATESVRRWSASEDYWWRRIALVPIVALNIASQGGPGDTRRTLDICARLASDQTDMVAKGMSWALRGLAVRDPYAVRCFLRDHRRHLPSRVRREVMNKLETGLKNPRRQ